MATYAFTFMDVFAEEPLEGNLLAVIQDADSLDDATMATIARRLRLSCTSFLLAPTSPIASYQHRIFFTSGEAPFAGLPSMGAAAVWARSQGMRSGDVIQQTKSGEQRLRVELHDTAGMVTYWQDAADFGQLVTARPILEAIGLTIDDQHQVLPAQIVSTGLPTLILPVEDADRLSAIEVNPDRLSQAMPSREDDHRPFVCYIVAEAAAGEWRARSFGIDPAEDEDPATGAAAGAFGAYLAQYLDIYRFAIEQGVHMGCPSRLYVDTSTGIAVSGKIQFIGNGLINLP